MDPTKLSENIFTKGEHNVTFKVEGREEGMGYFKASEGSSIGLIVLQEWWGLNATMVNLTNKYADAGFNSLSVDIYRGSLAKNSEEAGHLMGGLDWDGAIKDIGGAVEFLRKEKKCSKVGVTGYCMGGALTIKAAVNLEIDCAVPYYGVPDLSKTAIEKIKCPVLAMFGENDKAAGFSDVETAKNLEQLFIEHKVNGKVKIWPNAGHAFMNPDNKNGYDEATCKLAFEETCEFIKKTCS